MTGRNGHGHCRTGSWDVRKRSRPPSIRIAVAEIRQLKTEGKLVEDYILMVKDSADTYSVVPGKPPKSDVVIVVTDADGKMTHTYSGMRRTPAKAP